MVAPRAITWTRAARRKGAAEASVMPLFRTRVRISTESSALQDVVVSLDWLSGRDRTVVDGFWAFLVRKMGDAVRAA